MLLRNPLKAPYFAHRICADQMSEVWANSLNACLDKKIRSFYRFTLWSFYCAFCWGEKEKRFNLIIVADLRKYFMIITEIGKYIF